MAIVGATTWGTTLAVILAARDRPVTLLARTETEAQELNAQRQHARFLPGVPFPESLTVSSDSDQGVSTADLIILAVPSEHLRSNLGLVSHAISSGATILSVAKGLELPQGKRMSQVMHEVLPGHLHPGICVLSGPNLAKEIIRGKLSSTVVAGQDPDHCRVAQDILMSNTFRVYTSDDVIGVELGGALKNIIALGAGIADGLDAGDNAKAAFITRGLAEITRLGVAAGAKPLTFAGLAGLGDLVATCASRLSRNHSVGRQLAQGLSWPEIRRTMDNVAEGVNTTNAALTMARSLDVEMPIAQTTYQVLFEGLSPQDAVAQLMERPPRSEW
ncbi:MAG: glycerol-3-phosphate dehydrogenase [SAR202 cluster bacterium Io17-Chloro-G2]|nr:MAG: glycerol-3-phosphate dehydrogenase [SAR202 cluster bacterium Io17-Chloro-G2]